LFHLSVSWSDSIILHTKNLKVKNYFSIDSFKKLSIIKKIKVVIEHLSATEKTILGFLLFVILISGYLTLNDYLNKNFKVMVPDYGGSFTEGSIGSPRFINPLLATSETDKSLTAIIYSGLMRTNSAGEIVLDLADKVEISDDGLQYTFHISDNAKFHDNKSVTSDDVIFTVNKAKDPELKSPKRSNWEGVLVERVDDKTVRFTLNQEYEPFLKNTTLGILPRHIWEGVTSAEFAFSIYNSNPIGSGPYKIQKITRDSLGIPKTYLLESYKDFILGRPYIDSITFRFAKNEDELIELYKNGKVEALHGISPEKAKKLLDEDFNIETVSLPRIFGIFFNQDKANVLASNSVRNALNIATPKDRIIGEVLFGFGEAINSPIPNIFKNGDEINNNEDENVSEEQRILKAQSILEEAGWKKNEQGIYTIENKKDGKKILSFSIATSNIKELVDAANKTAEVWNKVGAQIEVKVYDPNDFNQNVIRQRNYDAILFGLVVGKTSDLYAFWHSSQRNDPGLNISGYANVKTDAILEKTRTILNQLEIQEDLLKFETEIKKDSPAVFLYSPKFIYSVPDKIKGNEINHLVTADERFADVYKWYINTEQILKVFKNEES
jgi:peptide/nickel transport system substrate-binding protein